MPCNRFRFIFSWDLSTKDKRSTIFNKQLLEVLFTVNKVKEQGVSYFNINRRYDDLLAELFDNSRSDDEEASPDTRDTASFCNAGNPTMVVIDEALFFPLFRGSNGTFISCIVGDVK